MFLRLKLDIVLLLRIDGMTDDDHLREAVRKTRAACARHPQDALLQGDLKLAEELLGLSTSVDDAPKTVSLISSLELLPQLADYHVQLYKNDLRLRVSVHAFPVQVVDSLPGEDQLGAPEGLSGWENVLHKAALGKEEKGSINKMQRELQLRETAF